MSVKDLSQGDFQFYKSYADKMRACHDREFMEEIDPAIIRAFYRGRKTKDARFTRTGYGMTNDEHILMLCTVFSAGNTILPNLYYQNIWPIITGLRGNNPMSNPDDAAALMSALIKMYMKKNDAKFENQDAVLNGYFFGLGWKKLGYYRSQEPDESISEEPETIREPKPFNFMEMIGVQKEEPTPLQSSNSIEFNDDEGLFNSSESPLNVMLDHKSDLRNGKVRLHRVEKTLYDLMNFGSYDAEVLKEVYEKYKHARGTRFDTRDIDLCVNELHIRQRNGVWVLTWIDEFNKPLQYEKSLFQGKGFQLVPLAFTNEPGARYPISHMKIAVQVQDKIDKMASVFYEHISRARNLLLINEKDLSKGTVDAIENNKVHGIGLTNKPITPGTFAHVQSPPIQNDLPSLMALCQQNLIEVMGADAQLVSGKSSNKTLGQDELARVGTKIRESGMQDRVGDFMVEQFEKEAQLLSQYSEASIELELTGEDYSDPIRAGQFERQSVKFMSQDNPLPARKFVENIEFKFDVNAEDGQKPNTEKIMTDIERVIAFTSNPVVENAILEDGFKIKTGSLAKEWLNQVKSLGNPRKYMEKLNSLQMAAIQTKKMMMSGVEGQGPKASIETKESQRPIAGKPESIEREPTSSQVSE